MTTLKLFSAALILSAAVATPVLAQEAIQEPGNWSFYHPNGDLLHAGSTRPADAMATQLRGDVFGMRMAVKPHKRLAVRTSAKGY